MRVTLVYTCALLVYKGTVNVNEGTWFTSSPLVLARALA